MLKFLLLNFLILSIIGGRCRNSIKILGYKVHIMYLSYSIFINILYF